MAAGRATRRPFLAAPFALILLAAWTSWKAAAFLGLAGGRAPRAPASSALRAVTEAKASTGTGFADDGGKKKKKQKLSLKDAMARQKQKEAKQDMADKKEEAKLSPEFTFWEGPPSSTECLFPFLSCFLVIGIIPFISAVNRQFRVKYKITDRRISVSSGWDGKDVTEFSYQEIYEVKYGMRFLGYCADLRVNLRDGAKVEIFGLLNFFDNYQFILDRLEPDARKRSSEMPK